MRIPLSIALLLCMSLNVAAASDADTTRIASLTSSSVEEQHRPRLQLYGFVRNYMCYDSRRCYSTLGEMFNIMPMDEALNGDGTEDLNAVHEFTFVSFTSRVGLDIAGPRIWNAASSAKIEADFCGFGANNTMLRIRQAYVRLEWQRVSVTCGQTWHPMSILVMPSVSGLATGAPFAPFNRSPQLNVEAGLGGQWLLTAAAIYQFPNASTGPDGITYHYSRWSGYPELYVGIRRVGRHLTAGVGADLLSIMPRRYSMIQREVTESDGTVSMQEVAVRADDHVTGISAEAFADYRYGKFNIKGKVIYGENTAHLTMVSGFGATAYDPTTGSYDYAPIRSVTMWLNATYGTRLRVGIMGGLMQNLGAARDFISTDDFWMRGAKNVDYIYRISPSLTYTVKNLTLSLETDYTVAGYGDVAIDGRSHAQRNVGNLRVCTMVKYSF